MLWITSVRYATHSVPSPNCLARRRTEAREQDVYGRQRAAGRVWYSRLSGSSATDPQSSYSLLLLVTVANNSDNNDRTRRSALIALPNRLLRHSQSVPFARRPRSRFIALFGPKVISCRRFNA